MKIFSLWGSWILLNEVKVYLEIHARENKIRTHYMVEKVKNTSYIC
jgi:hypothetical protein